MGKRKSIFAGVKISIEGFTAGVIMAMGLKIGLTPTKRGIFMFLAENFCHSTEGISPVLSYDCWMLYSGLLILATLITAISILLIARKSESILKGIITYGFGFLVGFATIYLTDL